MWYIRGIECAEDAIVRQEIEGHDPKPLPEWYDEGEEPMLDPEDDDWDIDWQDEDPWYYDWDEPKGYV